MIGSARLLEARPGPAAARRHRGRALLWSLRHYAHPSNNERPGPQPHKQTLNNVRTRPVVQCLPMGRCAYPRLGLLVWALHPIRRHYTPSVRVHRHVTGAAPRNGCTASDSSPAHQSTRKGDEGQLRFREVDHVHQSTRNSDEAVLPTVRHSHPCTHRPHFHLFQEAVHPIRRHYTPSVRVQRHVTGVVPRVWLRPWLWLGLSLSGVTPLRWVLHLEGSEFSDRLLREGCAE